MLVLCRACNEGMHEYELEAEFVRTTLGAGLRHLGYPCIVAAGANAATLHYESNAAVIGPDELVLVDAGAEFRQAQHIRITTSPLNVLLNHDLVAPNSKCMHSAIGTCRHAHADMHIYSCETSLQVQSCRNVTQVQTVCHYVFCWCKSVKG